MNGRKLAATLAVTAAVGGTLVGCGDRITATKTWALDPQFQTTGARSHTQTQTITGSLGPGTAFRERCVFPFTQGPARGQCVLFFDAGQRFYAASGTGTLDGVGTFRSLDRSGSTGSLEVKIVGELGSTEGRFEVIAHPG
jgi:hypothetical protein